MATKCRILKGGYCEITQYYGGENNHLGIDIVGKNYTIDTVLAHTSGTVVLIQTGQVNNQGSTGNASYGNFVKINHGNGYYTLYAHLNNVSVKIGDKVKIGQELGEMGNTGNSYGSHTHFEVFKNNVRVNPLEYLDKDLFNSVTESVTRDENKNQLRVNVDNLRVRKEASINSEIIGAAKQNAIYNFYEKVNKDGYTWYRIDDNEWVANKDNWLTIYDINSNSDNNEIQILKDKITLLEKENQQLKEMNNQFNTFVASKTDFYYIKLSENEKLIYKRISEE
ncbi:MAG: M23 family metallopeptidase [Firmicutes bacterium]|nr:M23 family metallopeptidase [Bacillota bacterium]